jgi:serine/threonine protein kinase HipA of HipAB toxin-antitoxin module
VDVNIKSREDLARVGGDSKACHYERDHFNAYFDTSTLRHAQFRLLSGHIKVGRDILCVMMVKSGIIRDAAVEASGVARASAQAFSAI